MSDLTSRWSALLASGRAEWRRGMTARWPGSLHDTTTLVVGVFSDGRPLGQHSDPPPDAAPDWSDGPTRGALLDQVRERWRAPYATPAWRPGWGGVDTWDWRGEAVTGLRIPSGATEIEALIAALEAAPEGA